MPKYRVLIDTIIEGRRVVEDAIIPSPLIPVLSDEAAQGYIDAGLLEAFEEEKAKSEADKQAAETPKPKATSARGPAA